MLRSMFRGKFGKEIVMYGVADLVLCLSGYNGLVGKHIDWCNYFHGGFSLG